VKFIDEYVISFHGSKDGIHEYEFDVRPEFFEYYENPDYPGGNLKVKVLLDRKPQILKLDFIITGHIKLYCDRCLEIFDYPVGSNEILFVKFGDDFEELDDNLIIIPRDEKQINIAQFIYEFAILNLPFKRVHPENEDGVSACDPDMLKKIEELSKKVKEKTDPRWDNLRKIISNK
jgi:uncharacterized protein